MSKFTRTYCRMPLPKSLFGFISLHTATELISLALVFNKVTGVFGLLAILTGYQLSLLQLGTYIYSIGVLVALAFLVPNIRKQNPWGCLSLAWLYTIDTAITSLETAFFALEWYFTNSSTGYNVADVLAEGLDTMRLQGGSVSHETAFSMVAITALTLVRIYFSLVVMAFARDVLQRYMQTVEVKSESGPFAVELPDGEGRRGRMGRVMVSFGREYWLGYKMEEDVKC